MKQHNYDVVLFDLDGTIVLSEEGITSGVAYALDKMGIVENDKKGLRKFIGPSLYESFSKFYGFTKEESVVCVDIYREYYEKTGIKQNILVDDMDNLIRDLHSRGKKLYVTTGKPTEFAKIILDDFKILQYFDDVIGCNLDGTRMEKSEVVSEALKLADNRNAVLIGDREHDVIGAVQTGIDSIWVSFGYGTQELLKPYTPTFMAHNVNEIRDILIS